MVDMIDVNIKKDEYISMIPKKYISGSSRKSYACLHYVYVWRQYICFLGCLEIKFVICIKVV